MNTILFTKKILNLNEYYLYHVTLKIQFNGPTSVFILHGNIVYAFT